MLGWLGLHFLGPREGGECFFGTRVKIPQPPLLVINNHSRLRMGGLIFLRHTDGGTDFFYQYSYFLGASGKPLYFCVLKFLLTSFCTAPPAINNDRSLKRQMFHKLFGAIPFEILGWN